MATVNARQVWNTKRVSSTTWTPLLTTDVGTAESPGRLADKSVQIIGTAGAGGSVNIQGSNDGTTWVSLTASAAATPGQSLATAAPGVYQIIENTLFVRPSVVGGDGTTSLTVILTCETTA